MEELDAGFCDNCGKPLAADAKSCQACGAPAGQSVGHTHQTASVKTSSPVISQTQQIKSSQPAVAHKTSLQNLSSGSQQDKFGSAQETPNVDQNGDQHSIIPRNLASPVLAMICFLACGALLLITKLTFMASFKEDAFGSAVDIGSIIVAILIGALSFALLQRSYAAVSVSAGILIVSLFLVQLVQQLITGANNQMPQMLFYFLFLFGIIIIGILLIGSVNGKLPTGLVAGISLTTLAAWLIYKAWQVTQIIQIMSQYPSYVASRYSNYLWNNIFWGIGLASLTVGAMVLLLAAPSKNDLMRARMGARQ